MASMLDEMFDGNEMNTVNIETPWTRYKKLLLSLTEYLHHKGREEAFKMFFSGSISDKHWDDDIEIWLWKLEKSGIVNMNQLEILSSFLEPLEDSEQMLSKISEFRCLLRLVGMILNCESKASEDTCIYSPPIKIEKFKISEDLFSLKKNWEEEIENAPNISKALIKKIYSQATQRIIEVASESNQNNHSCFLEAIFIAEFLTAKIKGMAQ